MTEESDHSVECLLNTGVNLFVATLNRPHIKEVPESWYSEPHTNTPTERRRRLVVGRNWRRSGYGVVVNTIIL